RSAASPRFHEVMLVRDRADDALGSRGSLPVIHGTRPWEPACRMATKSEPRADATAASARGSDCYRGGLCLLVAVAPTIAHTTCTLFQDLPCNRQEVIA